MGRGNSEDERKKLMREILKVSKEGSTKEEMERRLGLSRQQLREVSAELADKGFLRYLETGLYITTEDGYRFMDSEFTGSR